ncbi:MAG: hypothetical protein U0Y68_00825 [Blastocatellia bacterium]
MQLITGTSAKEGNGLLSILTDELAGLTRAHQRKSSNANEST